MVIVVRLHANRGKAVSVARVLAKELCIHSVDLEGTSMIVIVDDPASTHQLQNRMDASLYIAAKHYYVVLFLDRLVFGNRVWVQAPPIPQQERGSGHETAPLTERGSGHETASHTHPSPKEDLGTKLQATPTLHRKSVSGHETPISSPRA